ncbi:uncharacterized protein B0I36DRAFT_430278 [Microdochium trichocladiopsis]|uniref:Uncharacterized protein n=1 Tax=Microdochium trichocladiopsis TaxID=1682393 RepID=A0A9P8YB35_9PEZI|nr:uncharacterized protein B0I36DRAFT_430278 [Microdochium trichocladiopsis]KAH7032932.1 hypothetical protein B0I36DRAFT_430278 [Microdochium trichocladiopsis]
MASSIPLWGSVQQVGRQTSAEDGLRRSLGEQAGTPRGRAFGDGGVVMQVGRGKGADQARSTCVTTPGFGTSNDAGRGPGGREKVGPVPGTYLRKFRRFWQTLRRAKSTLPAVQHEWFRHQDTPLGTIGLSVALARGHGGWSEPFIRCFG